MLFVFHGIDRVDAPDLRTELQEAHAAYWRSRPNPVGGRLLSADGTPCGTVIVVEAVDLTECTRLVAADPYVVGGLFATTSLHAFRAVDWPGHHPGHQSGLQR